jgi:V/A-type H+-transporting ATPase subunit K
MKLDMMKMILWLGHLGFIGFVSFTVLLLLGISPVTAAESAAATSALPEDAVAWGFIAAAVSTGLSALGAGLAVSNVGSAAIGAMAEKPEILGRTLIVIGLAEGIAIYGLIVSILILNQII